MQPAEQAISQEALGEIVKIIMNSDVSLPPPNMDSADAVPIANPVSREEIQLELTSLPQDQLLLSFRHFQVWYGSSDQIPRILHEITRVRETTFRDFQQGSARSVDTDSFDESYEHLFVWDVEGRSIVGAYRLGRSDELVKTRGPSGVYLSNFFEFDSDFFSKTPRLEIGRSFVALDYQKNHNSLYLLWSGLCRYLAHHPQYREMYGLVSISRVYHARTIAVIRDVLCEPSEHVHAKRILELDLGVEWRDYLTNQKLSLREVSWIVKALESGERDIPALIRHYYKLGARFCASAVDDRFNNTPGLFMEINVPSIPEKYFKMYFGNETYRYLNYDPKKSETEQNEGSQYTFGGQDKEKLSTTAKSRKILRVVDEPSSHWTYGFLVGTISLAFASAPGGLSGPQGFVLGVLAVVSVLVGFERIMRDGSKTNGGVDGSS